MTNVRPSHEKSDLVLGLERLKAVAICSRCDALAQFICSPSRATRIEWRATLPRPEGGRPFRIDRKSLRKIPPRDESGI